MRPDDFIALIISAIAQTMKADGSVADGELAAARSLIDGMLVGKEQRDAAWQLLEDTLISGFGTRPSGVFTPGQERAYVQALERIVIADGSVAATEVAVVSRLLLEAGIPIERVKAVSPSLHSWCSVKRDPATSVGKPAVWE